MLPVGALGWGRATGDPHGGCTFAVGGPAPQGIHSNKPLPPYRSICITLQTLHHTSNSALLAPSSWCDAHHEYLVLPLLAPLSAMHLLAGRSMLRVWSALAQEKHELESKIQEAQESICHKAQVEPPPQGATSNHARARAHTHKYRRIGSLASHTHKYRRIGSLVNPTR